MDGTVEKDINLAISQNLAVLLRVMGYRVEMTREDDRALNSEDAGSVREKKVSDMHNRLAMYEQASVVISIHQNHFSQAQYNGAQVFYAPQNAQSRLLGYAIRETILSLVQPENHRELKKADDSVYLLANTTVPAALVECGFLSNAEECAKLNDEQYRRRMAFAVAGGVMTFLGENG